MPVDIAGLDRASVIQALYDHAKPLGLGFLQFRVGPLPRAEAEALVGESLDYLHGRVMKVRIAADRDDFNELLFDRDNGPGEAARAVAEVRNA